MLTIKIKIFLNLLVWTTKIDVKEIFTKIIVFSEIMSVIRVTVYYQLDVLFII